MNPWVLAYDGFDPAGERLREALCTLGNGYFATRGAAPEAAAGAVHYPGTYVAGCYNRLVSRVADREVENEDLVNVANWLPLTIRPDGGEWLDLQAQEVLGYRQELDLRRGVLTRLIRVRYPDGRVIGVTQRRFVSMDDAHLAGLETLADRAAALAADGDLRLAGHLAEMAAQAAPDDAGVHRVRAEVFAQRAGEELSTMSKGVFSWAADESQVRLAELGD